jgi:hypothetical protein
MGALTDIKYEKGTTGSSYGNSVYFPDSTTSYIQALRNAAKPKQTTVNNATNPGYSSLSPAQRAGLLNANGGWGGLGAVGGTAASSTPFGSPYGYAVARTNVSAPGSALYRPGSVNIAPTPIPKIAVNPGQMAYKGGGNIDHAYGQAATSDWGINAAAESQVQLIKDWMVNELIPAAREQEIARGMARSPPSRDGSIRRSHSRTPHSHLSGRRPTRVRCWSTTRPRAHGSSSSTTCPTACRTPTPGGVWTIVSSTRTSA